MKSRRFYTIFLTLIVVLFLFYGFVEAQPAAATNPAEEDARIARLVGLAKVWGTVKFFHPYLAYREIDWDKALIETIPKVNAAGTAQEYQNAINSMLSALGDKNTRARIVAEMPKTVTNQAATVENKEPVRFENDALVIDASGVAKAIMSANNRLPEFVTKTNTLLPGAKAVLIDTRSDSESETEEAYYLDYYLQAILPAMLDRNVPVASARYRIHNGYAPQTGSTSGGYYSGLITDAPQTITGNNKAKSPPMIFLVGEKTNLAETLSGLQAANAAFVVQDGEAATEAGVISHTIKLPENVRVEMRTSETVSPDGRLGFSADIIAPKGDAMTAARRILAENKFVSNRTKTAPTFPAQVSQKDKAYPEMEFPNTEYRLLALFRFWTVINLFFPYKHLTDEPWDDILPRYIPKFEANKNNEDYTVTVREMVAEIQDSHGTVSGGFRKPAFYPPVSVKFLENQTYIDYVFDEVVGVKIGDVVTEIDGEPVQKFAEKQIRQIAASTPQALQRVLHRGLLRGAKDSKVKLTLRDLTGNSRQVELTRNVANTDARWNKADNPEKTLPVFGMLPSGYGYVDLARLTIADVDKMFETIKLTPATIFDMRGYPQGTAWAIAPRLTEKKNVAAAIFSRPIWTAKSLGDSDFTNGTNFTFVQKLPEISGDIYKGKVVMLIDENAQSQSEHTAMFFESATDVTFIGMPTAGANGDITRMFLPGNLTVTFSGHDVRHADGRQLQRIGIQPHIKVEPTIRGLIVERRDEILEAAVKFLQTTIKN